METIECPPATKHLVERDADSSAPRQYRLVNAGCQAQDGGSRRGGKAMASSNRFHDYDVVKVMWLYRAALEQS